MNKPAFPVLAGVILPHPPIIVPGVQPGRHQAMKTVAALRQIADHVTRLNPDTLIVISPHAPLFSDYLFFYDSDPLQGDLGRFGADDCELRFSRDQELQSEWIRELEQEKIPAGPLTTSQLKRLRLDQKLDHGCIVPLYFLSEQKKDLPIIALSCSQLDRVQIYQAGSALTRAAERLGRRVVILASGDQSHKVDSASPYGSCPEGEQYDRAICRGLEQADKAALLEISPSLAEKAAECGYRSLVMLLGAFSGRPMISELLAYEAPYGIGYCTALLKPDPRDSGPEPDALAEVLQRRRQNRRQEDTQVSVPVRIARRTLEALLRNGQRLSLQDLAHEQQLAPEFFTGQAGVFVSMKKWGNLRGCIGTTEATTDSIAQEIIQNAISAATKDPRFDPVEATELEDLDINVDILQKSEPVQDVSQLDKQKYGVIVRSGIRSGLLLPDLEGVDSVEEQLEIACRKAGINPQEPYQIERFQVQRYT